MKVLDNQLCPFFKHANHKGELDREREKRKTPVGYMFSKNQWSHSDERPNIFQTGIASLEAFWKSHKDKYLITRVQNTLPTTPWQLNLFKALESNYRWGSNFADSRLFCNRTDLGNVAKRILKFLPWRLKHWTLRRRYKLFPFHCPEIGKIHNLKKKNCHWVNAVS